MELETGLGNAVRLQGELLPPLFELRFLRDVSLNHGIRAEFFLRRDARHWIIDLAGDDAGFLVGAGRQWPHHLAAAVVAVGLREFCPGVRRRPPEHAGVDHIAEAWRGGEITVDRGGFDGSSNRSRLVNRSAVGMRGNGPLTGRNIRHGLLTNCGTFAHLAGSFRTLGRLRLFRVGFRFFGRACSLALDIGRIRRVLAFTGCQHAFARALGVRISRGTGEGLRLRVSSRGALSHLIEIRLNVEGIEIAIA